MVPPPSIPLWVAVLYCSDRTADKISGNHGLDVAEVHRAVVARRGLRVRRHEDDRGVRFIARPMIHGAPVLVVMFRDPDDVDAYHLASAYFDR